MLKPHILILAAGQGKRMRSQTPKVLHSVLFHPMLHHVLDLSYSLAQSSVSVIVGHGEAEVRKACSSYSGLQYFKQSEQRGTAHAISMAKEFLKKSGGHTLILSGDVPLLRKESVEALLSAHEKNKNALTLVTTRLADPSGYGRILRTAKKVTGIREQADASAKEAKIQEINAGIYCFETKLLLEALDSISDQNKQGEFYLTDAVSYLVKKKKKVEGFEFNDSSETLGINDRVQLANAENILQSRINRQWMLAGVTLHRPDTIFIDHRSELSQDAEIESGCTVVESKIGESARLKQGSYIHQSKIGKSAQVGPYAHLRPGTILEAEVKIGNFVEVKNSKMGKGSKASHLSYIGDAEVGSESNLGCGFITCNYDGKKKHHTKIGDSVFVGSDSQMVAPVEIGSGSFVAAGTTVTKSVPPDSLVFARTAQTTKPGYAKKYRK